MICALVNEKNNILRSFIASVALLLGLLLPFSIDAQEIDSLRVAEPIVKVDSLVEVDSLSVALAKEM